MEKHAYCSECGRYVQLADDRCPAGHAADSLRDVRSGPLPAGAAQGAGAAQAVGAAAAGGAPAVETAPRAGGSNAPRAAESATADSEPSETLSRVLAWLFVLVPALGLSAVMVALTEPQYEGAGLGTVGAWLAAFATVVVTVGGALLWGWLKFSRKHG